MVRVALVAVLTFLLPTVCGAAPPFYSGAPVHGRVVDAETNEPLAGVYVVTQTILSTGLFIHGEHVERLHVAETVTDANGDYHLPAWGPKARPPFSELTGGDPALIYFKPAYRPEWRGNPMSPLNEDAVRTSRWDGQTITLTRFRGTPAEWAEMLERVQRTLAWGVLLGDVVRRLNDYWKFMPRTVWAIEQERRGLPERLRTVPHRLDSWGITDSELRARIPQKEPNP